MLVAVQAALHRREVRKQQSKTRRTRIELLARAPLFLLALALMAAQRQALAQPTNQLLTNAADVISLPAERAWQHLPVAVRGVVTASDPALKGRFFVQDSTGGVFVDNANRSRPEPGDVVEVSGISDAGAFAPIISTPTVRKIGRAPLPPARPVSLDRLMSGAEDSQRIEVSGTVRAAQVNGSRMVLDVVSGGYRFRVYAALAANLEPESLVAAQVHVRGTAAEAHNPSLRQLIAVEVYVPILEDFQLDQREPADPYDEPVKPLSSLAQYRRDNSPNQRVHVKGVVTLQRLGENLFVQDPSGGLRIQTRQMVECSPGDVIEAVGFPGFENFLPVLQDAVFRKTPEPRVVVKPAPEPIEDLQQGLHHAGYVSLKGKLVDRTVRQVRRQAPAPPDTRTTLVLETSNFVFTAEDEGPSAGNELGAIPIGSTVEVSGICLLEIDRAGKVRAFQVLLGGPRGVSILAKPSWLTPQRLLVGLGILGLGSIVIAGWTVMVSKKNSTLNFLIREREKAQVELQQAHDLLEQRVKERTDELKFQISARKESELQFKAVLAERTRLAQELHDTVEQTLTGIALQLDTSAKLYERNPQGTLRHLELARNLMAKSQVEVRRSVWDLRCRALEQFDLPGALLRSGRQITYGTNIQVELETKGQARALPEVVEENLLRIGQEALTNILKHSRGTRAKINLKFDAHEVVLEVNDNGSGFAPENCAGPQDGHFGVLGMSERAKRLGGRFILNTTLDKGTTVRVEIPLDPAHEFAAPAINSNGEL